MKYRIVLTLYIVLVQGQVNRNFRLVLNEMGPGRTSQAWYFHSPVSVHVLSNLLNELRKRDKMPGLHFISFPKLV